MKSMKSHRIERLQNELKKLFNLALSQKLNDPRFRWVVVTDIILSKDLTHTKVFYSHYNNPLSHEQIKENLEKASGFLKKQIAGAKLMRTIPQILYIYDETEDRAAKVDTLLASVKDDYNDEDYDPDIDIDDYLEDDDYYDFEEDEKDFEDIEDLEEDDEF